MQVYIDEAVKNLRSFSVIGTIENFDEWCNRSEKVFGRRLVVERTNASPRKDINEQIKNDDRILKTIATLCESDMRIYKLIVESSK